jgi:hypothetical protein
MLFYKFCKSLFTTIIIVMFIINFLFCFFSVLCLQLAIRLLMHHTKITDWTELN